IVLEKSGQDLQRYLVEQNHLQLTAALSLAINITENIGKIHKHHIIHKDINPANILYEPQSDKITIIDFGISTTLSKETLKVANLNQLEGTLAYLSPEQTGRMNRGIDYRSDYYSLGVTLYQIFTGELPFKSTDPLELVYSHIAKTPPPPNLIDTAIPKPISDIIMKLMAKTAEDRYQTDYGIISDLQNCLIQLQKKGAVVDFKLGEHDLSGQFQIPEKLYGRETEVNYLLETFARVSQGNSELLLVAGYSGVGKSSLVHEVQKPIIERRGYFISGKFDQLKRNIPYSPFVQAMTGLVQQLLAGSESEIKQWKEQILEALGQNGTVITEAFPVLVKIIGEQPPLPALGPTETQNRFMFVFQSFISVLASAKHPLVLFLDDLQWADLPSLTLINAILLQPNIKYLLIIGAYRDNEVSAAHPLMLTMDKIHNEGIHTETLQLVPLNQNHVQQLLTDALSQPFEITLALSEICHAKTLGNPFFLNQFLHALIDEDLIVFDSSIGAWHWSLDKIKNRTSTDNVVDLVVGNLQKLPSETRELLKYAACLGNLFDLQILSFLSFKDPKQTAEVLEEALQNNFVLPINESYRFVINNKDSNAYYQFLHDKVQQAAYSLLDDNDKKSLHLKIGRYLLEKTSAKNKEDKIFDIINQFNLGIDLIIDEDEKISVTRLNLEAGKKAKISAAYAVALAYFEYGISLLGNNTWKTHYELTLELYTEATETAYLSNDFQKTAQFGDIVLSNAKTILDQVKIYEIKIYTYIAQNEPKEAVVTSLEILKKLGVPLPKKPNALHPIMSIIKSKFLLLSKNNERLVKLPMLTDPYKLNASNILSAAIAPTYYAAPALFPLCSLALFNLSIQYGYNKGTPASYATYGIILCHVLNDIDRGYEFGQLALKLVENYHATESESKISLMVNGFITHWKDPLRSSMAPLLIAHVRGIETGDLDYSAYSAYFYLCAALYVGVDLPQLAIDTKKFYEVCKNQYTHGIVVHSIALHGQIIDNLLGKTENPCIFTGNWYREDTMLQEVIDINHGFEVFHFYVLKLMMNYLFYDYQSAYEASLKVPDYLGAATASMPLKIYNFYESLTLIALSENATSSEKRKYLKKVHANQKQLKLWAKFSSVNCLHKFYLVEAELARINKNVDKAEKYYDLAMQLSKQNEFIQEHALSSELAAKFYLAELKDMVAKGYMAEAYYSYTKWGAVAKLRQIETLYPNLLVQLTTSPNSNSVTITSTKNTQTSESLDLTTVVKASQTIAREIVLADLLKQLMIFVIESAGAQNGYLLLKKEEQWNIEASVVSEKVTVIQSIPYVNELPKSVIQYVIHSKEFLVLENATQSNHFLSDPYIINNKPKSILAIPLLNLGILSGILYLENNLMTGAFTKKRIDLLNLLSAQIVISIENARLYTDMANLNRAYERFIPREFLSYLEKKNIIDVHLGDQVQKDMTVMFCDIRNFTTLSEKLTPQENFSFVNNFLSRLEPIISQSGGFIDKYIGDSIMAIYPSNTDSALASAISMIRNLKEYNNNHPDQAPIHAGIGLNSGLLMLGIVGAEHHMEGTVISDVVNVASRTESLTKTYNADLLITEETYNRLRNPSMYSIRRLDTVLAKGKSKPITIYEVFDNDIESLQFLKKQTKSDFEQGVAYFQQKNFLHALKVFNNVSRINPDDKETLLYILRCNDELMLLKESNQHD
ncbi:MAG: AAA family ATPase, partial [Gammaproteobacteria bacterium]